MDYRKRQYWKDLIKHHFYSFLERHVGKLQTPMRQVLLQLQIRNLFPTRVDALEMFGMHGLWHTMDYVGYVDTLDLKLPTPKTPYKCRHNKGQNT